jgi:hypothetical protein
MPEIPGSNPIPGGNMRGGGAIQPPNSGLGNSAGVSGAAPLAPSTTAPDRATQQQPRYFGFHTDASLMARIASQGLAPTLNNLRIAQQLLRYGQALDAEAIGQLAQIWGQYGAGDVLTLEALVVLLSQGLQVNGGNVAAMRQLLAGGPLSHLLARLTMAIKGDPNAKLTAFGTRLNAFWQLGQLDQNMLDQLGQFQSQLAGLAAELAKLNLRDFADATAQELGNLNDLLKAQQLLLKQSNPAQFLPFFIWREQQPMPAELVVQSEGGGANGTANFLKVTLAVETQHMGRVTVDLLSMRDTLSARFEVGDEKIKKHVDAKLVLLRQRLAAAGYEVDFLSAQPTGSSRAISALLPTRRDIKKLSRAHGVM